MDLVDEQLKIAKPSQLSVYQVIPIEQAIGYTIYAGKRVPNHSSQPHGRRGTWREKLP
ncbi:MAG: hypothetical protein Ct9H300mP11_29600 [Chloroflexota bacterium]|nr:MAG: hypothetical protein Ct9H300mP11_29600 [Chloroflexota bacterium]